MVECKILNPKDIKYIVIHCSDTDESHKSEDIHKLHLSFGWDGIGYHKIIRQDGVIENGRPEYWIGAHVKGFNNISLGICLIGKKNFSHEQFYSLKKILKNWKIKYKNAEVVGHNSFDYTDKTCPNFDVKNWYKKNIL
tara:strand:- start:261 stop:674 length:414 start_codon:yes stop_codon:yes gene_type:complete